MKPVKTVSVVIIALLAIVACHTEQKKSDTEKPEFRDSLENSIKEDQKIGFQKTLSFQNISFDIQSSGEGSIQQLSIQPRGLGTDNQKIILEIDGEVMNAQIEDLNSDGFPEILIYTKSAGSGSYGDVIGYSVNHGESISRISFPQLSENKEASLGYMGHDEFSIIDNSLIRRFPIYKEDDTNSHPTGGTRQIRYKLQDGEASRRFEIAEISKY